MTNIQPRFDIGDPNWTWYGYNNPYPVGVRGGGPPDATCYECDANIEDSDPEDGNLCDACRDEARLENLRREVSRLADVLVHDCDPHSETCWCFGEADVKAYEVAREALRIARDEAGA